MILECIHEPIAVVLIDENKVDGMAKLGELTTLPPGGTNVWLAIFDASSATIRHVSNLNGNSTKMTTYAYVLQC